MEPKLINCRVCGNPVSEYAPTCPTCGDPVAYRFGHAPKPASKNSSRGLLWWIGLIVVLFVLWSCVRSVGRIDDYSQTPAAAASSEAARAAPSYSLHVVNTACTREGAYARGAVTVINSGSITMPFAKAFFQFTDGAGNVVGTEDSYFSPNDIPPGSTASADVYARGISNAEKCRLSTVQDGDGNAASLN